MAACVGMRALQVPFGLVGSDLFISCVGTGGGDPDLVVGTGVGTDGVTITTPPTLPTLARNQWCVCVCA